MSAETTSKRGPGRPNKYDWSDKKDICQRLFVDEGKNIPAIIKFFSEQFGEDSDIPCRKAFTRQFTAWGFDMPKRGADRLDAEGQERLKARMTELWNQNVYQKDIKVILDEEGYDIKHYEFNKLWRQAGLRLRNETGYKAPPAKKRKRGSADVDESTEDIDDDAAAAAEDTVAGAEDTALDINTLPPFDPEQAAASRAERLWQLQAESDQKMATRKRRRRIRGYGHLPPDAPGMAPRYASETSLDECKAFLHLSNEMYNTVRKDFESICEEQGIKKKTVCGDGVWEASKQRLIRENMHLSAMMHPLQPDQDKKAIALDCLCADVTKRMRVKDRAITIAEANNTLDLNPTESKAVRRSFYEILASENFESKIMSGVDHWQHIRSRWHATSDRLQAAVAANDPKKNKCLDLLCHDATKRFREDRNRRGERSVTQKNTRYGPGPGPAWAATAPRARKNASDKQAPQLPEIREPRAAAAVMGRGYPPQESGNFIATLAQATGNINFDIDPALTNAEPYVSTETNNNAQIPAYFRLAPGSQLIGNHPNLWLGKLTSPTIEALHKAATCKTAGANVSKVNGILKNDAAGNEDSWVIDTDEELVVYLSEAGEKATFLVLLQGGYV